MLLPFRWARFIILQDLRSRIVFRQMSTEQPKPEQPTATPPKAEDANDSISDAQAEIKDLKHQHLLDLAEMENVRMRARRDVENERSFALSGFS